MKKHLFLCLSILNLTACAMAGGMAKEGVLSLTERSGREHFTLAGNLPANFQIQTTAQYYVLDPAKCQVHSPRLGYEVTREMVKQELTELKDQPHSFSLDIPLTYHIGNCDSQLGRLALEFRGRYGEKYWQKDADVGGIGLASSRPDTARGFNRDGTVKLRGICTWLFQISPLRLELNKILSCSETDESWHLDPDFAKRRSIGVTLDARELAGKKVLLEVRENPKEEPSMHRRWIETESGWKPCLGNEQSDRCQSPPVFKKFEMNGRECTVYPNCTE